MLAPLLIAPNYAGTGDVTQQIQFSLGDGEMFNVYGTAATDQVAQSTQAAGFFGSTGDAQTSQSAQTVQGSSTLLVTGSCDTIQANRQRTRSIGLGPVKGTPRPLRLSRGDSEERRPIVITIRTGG